MAEPGVVRPDGAESEIEPLFYPSNRLTLDAPWRWLRLGWHDLNQARAQSLTYGTGLAVFAYVVTALAWAGGNVVALFTLGVSFILAGPVLAFGVYSISRQLEQGRPPRLGVCWSESRNHLRNELLFALVMLVVLLIWARAASMVHVFFPIGEELGVLGVGRLGTVEDDARDVRGGRLVEDVGVFGLGVHGESPRRHWASALTGG